MEGVPGAAGIAVPAAEGQRQVFIRQPRELGIAQLRHASAQRLAVQGGRQPAEPRGVFPGQGAGAGGDEVAQVRGGKAVAVDEDAAAHAVEEHVGEVVRAGGDVAPGLQAIGGGHAFPEARGVLPQALREVGGELPRALQGVFQPVQGRMVQPRVRHRGPRARTVRRNPGLRGHEVGAEVAADLVFGPHRTAGAESLHLPVGQQDRGFPVPERPGGRGPQGFGRRGAV